MMPIKPNIPIKPIKPGRLSGSLCLLLFLLLPLMAQAQIIIGGNVYGGGNAGDTGGNCTVTIYGGDIDRVFGGARMANVGGRTFVNIDGTGGTSTESILINQVYGGNDIAGTIGTSEAALPAELTHVKRIPADDDDPQKNAVDNTWNTLVRVNSTTTHTKKDANNNTLDAILIGSLYAGGNGNYYHRKVGDTYYIYLTEKSFTDGEDPIATSTTGFTLPEIDKTYLEILGSTIAQVFGGGNNATVRVANLLYMNNPSAVVNEVFRDNVDLLLEPTRLSRMGFNPGYTKVSSDAFQIGFFFGGNNNTAMAIRPTWNLQGGKIRNLYSGGNRGDMTSPTGLLLDINPDAGNPTPLVIDNVYGGCRMSDVHPLNPDGTEVAHVYNIEGYNFPPELAARVLIRGGDVNNVYGGNDIRGKVHFGNAVGIYSSIRGDVYGGGNGSYPYTDNVDLKHHPTYSDLYYNPTEELEAAGIMPLQAKYRSVLALNQIRPHAEQVSIRIAGEDENHPTIIGGSVYCGGNSATLRRDYAHGSLSDYPIVELKIGSYAMADNVFLGNNGENMVKNTETEDVLQIMNGTDRTSDDSKFSSIDLEDEDVFGEYMEGVAMDIMPRVTFDNIENGDAETYVDYSTYIGSLYCGGNVGSMTNVGLTTLNFNGKLVVFDKVVGGSNKAYVAAKSGINAEYVGGILGSPEERSVGGYVDAGGNIKNRLVMNLNNLKIQPKRWKKDGSGDYVLDAYGNRQLEWNTIDSRTYNPATKTYNEMAPVTSGAGGRATADDLARRLKGGNIYGGCYENGIVNGNVVINLNKTLIDRDRLFDEVETNDVTGEAELYDHDYYNITKRNTGVILDEQGTDVFGAALNVFGGGKGADTEIWGSTVVNLNGGYTFQVFGGSEEGVIGRSIGTSAAADLTYSDDQYTFNGKLYEHNVKYSCYVNLCGTKAGVSKQADQSEEMAECEFMYGGGFFGPVCGNTVVNLGKGRVYNSFGGSCNGDILGTAETFVGRQVKAEYRIARPADVIDSDVFEQGFPWIRDYVYGANDLGGRVFGVTNYKNHVRGMRVYDPTDFDVIGKVHNPGNKVNPDVLQASAYVEYLQGRAVGIYGGCSGDYRYADSKFSRFTNASGEPLVDGSGNPIFYKPHVNNAFVNFRPTYYNVNNVVKRVYGGCEGISGETYRNKMQNSSYVLVDIPDGLGAYENTEVFGAGFSCGLGFGITKEVYNTDKEKGSAIIDLVRGDISAVYGGSYEEGVTRRTVVNVPAASTIKLNNIFGGAYGALILPPCDVYESYVNYHSDAALVTGAIYGGNNNERRTLYTHLNISSPVWSNREKGYLATVYGAGKGIDTWTEYTEVNLLNGAKVYEAYGGGEMGHVLNAESVQQYMQIYHTLNRPSPDIAAKNPKWSQADRWVGEVGSSAIKPAYEAEWAADWAAAWELGDYFTPNASYDNYVGNTLTNLSNAALVRSADELDATTAARLGNTGKKYNANVIINQGATVVNYAYGGGLGDTGDELSGDVYGTTYIALLGGEVKKDIYAAGTAGSVDNLFGANFTASANAYIQGGTVRNVYGGGWRGSVGYHPGAISDVANNADDVFGESNVVIGKYNGDSYLNGIPSVTRNVYGGGEGGCIFGTANVYVNNGYIGYRFKGANPATANPADYKEELHDVVEGDSLLYKSGNVFGGGYVANSYVDNSIIRMYGGTVRGSLYGGGELGPVGRGTMKADAPAPTGTVTNGPDGSAKIYKAGTTLVEMYEGHVLRDVFGGGRGYDNWGGEGYMTDAEKLTMDRSAKGYVFGRTRVNIRGGEIGTDEGMAENFGNVFGGSDVGFVYSAYNVSKSRMAIGKKSGTRYDNGDEGYYYDYEYNDLAGEEQFVLDDGYKLLTECTKVVIGPYCRVTAPGGVTLTGILYPQGAVIPPVDLNYLKANNLNEGDYNASGVVTAEEGITIASRTYLQGEYVPTYALHTLKDKTTDAAKWATMDDAGVIVHNAVFAGGNVSSGTTEVFAHATTVYGNSTATVHDVYHRDLITIGTGHTGGLYGDGNLTLVDGYRGLNITNYGTDYYNISMEISLDTYKALPKREQAYYELKYTCLKECTDNDGKTYTPAEGSLRASTITADELVLRFEGKNTPDGTPMLDSEGKPDPEYWEENGVCSRYAGRIMNTIQRADFCGVFGSRMVMQGAQDRVPEVVDHANYTINRVREVSLNRKTSVAGDTDPKHMTHGNYFGIYSNVNYLGALTSDVNFADVRTTNSTEEGLTADGKTFYAWKEAHKSDRKRNRGTCHNEVALASGVYLELTTENGTGSGIDEKDWGYVTGIIVLDLINVQQGIGGGFVYAKNVHGVPTYSRRLHATLTALNSSAITRKDFTYTTDDASQQEWETSGNFVHDSQTIIDNCYPESNRYKGSGKVPAHYWYIKGSVYIYDQYISAYTGAPNAYSKVVNIPLTISAASHGSMKLVNVMPNRYAYYAYNKYGGDSRKLGADDVLDINGKNYKLNDPISYWDYNLLSAAEQRLFVGKTYVTIAECTTGGRTYPAGYVMLPEEYEALREAAPTKTIEGNSVKAVRSHDNDVAFDFVFRESNNLSHETGYILTYETNNPKVWNKWYTQKSGAATDKITTAAYEALSALEKDAYYYAPTYKPKTNGLYGQKDYKVGAIIPEEVYNNYEGYDSDDDSTPDKGLRVEHPEVIPADGQAEFERAYVVTKIIEVTDRHGNPAHLYPGATIVESDFSVDKWASMSSSVAPAYVCTSTLQLENDDLLLVNTIMSATDKATYIADNTSLASDLNDVITPAYYCVTDGLYGGDYYATTENYRGLLAWSSLSESDRENFEFNYDALDLLIDSNFSRAEGQKYQYDGKNFTTALQARTNDATYSLARPVDYSATYKGVSAMTYRDQAGTTQTVAAGAELDREDFERLPNEQRHFAPVQVGEAGTYYVAHHSFIHGDVPYAAGQTIGSDTWASLSAEERECVTRFDFTTAEQNKMYFFCRENYTVNELGEGATVTNLKAGTGYDRQGDEVAITASQAFTTNAEVPVGVLITEANYTALTNRQTNFTIHGIAPMETSTLYVSRESDIYDLSTEKIITVIYEYDYEEADESGAHITPISERHVLNIHITFESGVPEVEDISAPKTVLPGTLVSLRSPNVTPGAYEVTGGGWMLFEKEDDTDSHNNGIEYTPNSDPLYWYQNGYYVAYYAQTYLGKTFSNAVPVSVANYHNLADVMSERNKAHHMYIDDPNVDRASKIYITTADGLDLFKDLYDLSLLDDTKVNTDRDGLITTDKSTGEDSPFKGHAQLKNHIRAERNLEFFLRTDLDHSRTSWTPIGYDGVCDDPSTPADEGATGQCFDGTFHGDGHTISGLDHSLFNHLCGDVYNLGVTGSFTGAGIAETGGGYVENCWVRTSATPADTKAVFGNPSRGSGTQLVNCYYPASNAYSETSNPRGNATKKSDRAFYNGEVAYDLNGFYLNKRYYDGTSLATGKAYKYFQQETDGTLAATPSEAYYPAAYALYPVDGKPAEIATRGYVENRYADGDFVYAGASIPDGSDERYYVDGEGNGHYCPIWPDDYLYFGQALNYGHMNGENGRDLRSPQDWPSAVNKSGGRIQTTLTGNRVYRAPAYFRSGNMDVAHFNSHAVFAQKRKKFDEANPDTLAYKDMTAIDFTGSNGDLSAGYQYGSIATSPYNNMTDGAFYPPLLDDDGLSSFYVVDLTNNLLAYTSNGASGSAAAKTDAAVSAHLPDAAYVESDATYRTVDVWDRYAGNVRGHWVRKTNEGFIAQNDHMLVDNQDFNAPIAYRFASGKRMWYQREPDNFVDRTKGWDAVSLPFTAELVTTDTKGEITHFYSGSESSKNETGTKLGHEYWLREFTDIQSTGAPAVVQAAFTYPTSLVSDPDKEVTNTFLWDYYYEATSGHRHKDQNSDTYQTYYSEARTYEKYPRLAAAKPYLIGFPGVTYYEFDLSGEFSPLTTAQPNPEEISAQTITFASETAASIGVSDAEMTGTVIEKDIDGTTYTFSFKPSYLNMAFAAGTNHYTLGADGSSYEMVPAASVPPAEPVADTPLNAFRPYFTLASAASVKGETRSIIFSNEHASFWEEGGEEDSEDEYTPYLDIRVRNRRIYVTSHYRTDITVRIYAASGALIRSVSIAPEQTIETQPLSYGVYMVNSKKVIVK